MWVIKYIVLCFFSIAPINVGFVDSSYTVDEGQEVTVCVEVTSHGGAPRPFSVTLTTENATAGIQFHAVTISIRSLASISFQRLMLTTCHYPKIYP